MSLIWQNLIAIFEIKFRIVKFSDKKALALAPTKTGEQG
jgi:hypothetical protein